MKAHLSPAVPALFFLAFAPASAQNTPSLTFSPPSLLFPKAPVGVRSAPTAITVSNPTDAPVELQEILVSGIDFAQSNDCGKELEPNAKCSILVTFKPAIPGDRLGSLEVVASGSNVPQFVALTGTGE